MRHVHFKDVCPGIVKRIRQTNGAFLDAVIAWAVTVPVDLKGGIDFATITRKLAAMNQSGWIVAEAGQDPARAPPFECSTLGYATIATACHNAGPDITG